MPKGLSGGVAPQTLSLSPHRPDALKPEQYQRPSESDVHGAVEHKVQGEVKGLEYVRYHDEHLVGGEAARVGLGPEVEQLGGRDEHEEHKHQGDEGEGNPVARLASSSVVAPCAPGGVGHRLAQPARLSQGLDKSHVTEGEDGDGDEVTQDGPQVGEGRVQAPRCDKGAVVDQVKRGVGVHPVRDDL